MSRFADQLPINTEPTAGNFLLATNDGDPKALERIPFDLVGGGSTEYTILDETALDEDSNIALVAGLYLYVGGVPANIDLSGLVDGGRVEIINYTAHRCYLFGFNNWNWNGTVTALAAMKGLILEKGGLIAAKHTNNLLLFNALANGLIQNARVGFGLTYTITQSSVYGTLIGTIDNLQDNLGTTGAATGIGTQWIKATFAVPTLVNNVTVGGGSMSGWGAVALYVNERKLQYSNDDTNWTDLVTISGVTDTGVNQFKTFATGGITARYWRIYTTSGYVATSEFNLAL